MKVLRVERLIILLLLLSYGGIANTRHADKLTVGIDLTYAPYDYWQGNEVSGFDADFMRLIAGRMQLQAEFKDTRIENIIIGLNANHYDVIASALYVNPQRAQQVDFLPYLQTGGVLVVRRDDSYRPKSLQDLCGKKIASMKGAAWISQLNQISQQYCQANQLGAIEVKEFPSAPEAAQALLAKAVDVQYEDAAVAQMVINALADRLTISTPEMIDPVLIGLAFNRQNRQLRLAVQQAFEQIKQSGEYQSLLKKYNLAEPSGQLLQANAPLLTDKVSMTTGFQWNYLLNLLWKAEFWQACLTVIELSTLAWVFSVIWGFVLAQAGLSNKRWLNKIAQGYVWFFRSLPLLVLLIFIYNLPQFWPASSLILSSPFMAGLIALTLSEAAYIAEIHRGALQAIAKGQAEAAKALGLSFFASQRLVIIPQAIRIALPSLANQYVTIIKLTSLVSVISLTEILLVGQQLYTRNFLVLETLLAVAFYYVLIVTLVTALMQRFEAKLDVTKQRQPLTSGQDFTYHPDQIPALKRQPQTALPAVQIRQACKQYQRNRVLDQVDLSVQYGDVIAIIGPSGSGKTTLLRSINGLEQLDSGDVQLAGKPLSQAIGTEVGMVFQHYNLFPHKNVLDNVMLAPLYHHRGNRQQIKSLALAMLDKVGLLQHAYKYPHQLSGGQQQRVAIARALAMQPAIMLFDEPTSALDPELVNDVLSVIEQLAKEGMTMLIITHEMNFALRVADRIIFMEQGKIGFDGTSQQINHHNNSRIARFINPEQIDYYI